MQPPQVPPTITPPPEQGPKILTFEEFSSRVPGRYGIDLKHNNFHIHFGIGPLAEAYRRQDYYKRFEQKHPDMSALLCKKVQKALKGQENYSEALRTVDRDLYEAYKIMRSYGASDNDLFS